LIAVAGGRPKTEPYVVAGVLPSTFNFSIIFTPASKVDVLLPFPNCAETDNWGSTLAVIGRLKPGVSLVQARREFEVLNDRIKKAHPERGTDFAAVMSPLKEHVSGSYGRPFLILAAAVSSVLLIACANLSNLLLARATTRRKETALRLALGATRGRLIRQMLTESSLLSICGAVLGLLLAYFTTRTVAQTRAFDIPLLSSVDVDSQALGFTLAVAFVCGILFGILPAWRFSRSELHDDLKDSGRGSTQGKGHSRVRDSLVVLEVAATCVLLVGAGLLVRSFVRLLEVDPGFSPEKALTWRIQPSRSFANREEQTAYFRALVNTVAAMPGVESAGLTDALPLGRNRSWTARAKGVTYRPGESPEVLPRIVDENYLQTMKIPLHSGRLLERDDLTRQNRVAVISEALAQRLWPKEIAVGKILVIDTEFEVVGVVGNVRHAGLDRAPEPEIYLLGGQNESGWSTEDLVVRTKVSPVILVPGMRAALRQFDPGMPTGEFRTLGDIIDRSVSSKRLITALMGSFSLLAMLLAAVGIYGVIAYSVGQRTSELGIRFALGASASDIYRLVIGEGMRPVLYGLGVGGIVALALSQVLRALLFGIEAADPVSFAIAGMIVTLTGVLACWLPARRAAKVDPMVALRYD
jgi:predicted permease